jgi:preprotein translocase SecE subunit
MNWATELVKTISGLDLTPNYAYLYLVFIAVTIGFIAWTLYYALLKGAVKELDYVEWLSLKDTVKYTVITLMAIVLFSSLLFGYDFLLDQLVSTIVQYANR